MFITDWLKKRTLIFYLSAFSFLLLIIQPNIKAIPILLIWLLLFFKSKENKNNLTISSWLLSIITVIPLAFIFYSVWSPSSIIKTITSNIGINTKVFVTVISVILGIISIYTIKVIYSNVYSYVSDFVKNNSTPVDILNNNVQWIDLLIIFLTAIITITFISRSSPCYPLNNWDDTNFFLTVGKSLLHGQVLYSDIYEQKGPLLFFIFMIPALISETSFIGVYFLEIVSAFFFLLYSYKIATLYADKKIIIFLPLYSFIIYSTTAFVYGGSVEEFCLPLLTCSIYYLIEIFHSDFKYISAKKSLLTGIFIGCVFWIKYTMIGMYFGYILVILIACMKRKNYFKFLKTSGYILSGFLLVSIPIFIYFIVNHSINDLFTVYFYNNLFLYGKKGSDFSFFSQIIYSFKQIIYAFNMNKHVFILITIGLLYVFILNKKLFLCIIPEFITCVIFVFIRDAHTYYPFILCIFMPFIYAGFGSLINKLCKFKKFKKLTLCFISIIQIGLCILYFNKSINSKLFLKSKDTLPQYKLAEVINNSNDKTILNYHMLDAGLYTVTGTIPNTRYFCTFNIDIPEMQEEQKKYIKEGRTNFIVTLENLTLPNYSLVKTVFFKDDRSNEILTYYLYQRNSQ